MMLYPPELEPPANPAQFNHGVPVLRSLSIEQFRISRDDLKFISAESDKILRKSALKPGNLVADQLNNRYSVSKTTTASTAQNTTPVATVLAMPMKLNDSPVRPISVNANPIHSE